MSLPFEEEIVYQGPGIGLKEKRSYPLPTQPIEGYREIVCKGEGCEDCPLTCAIGCDRWPGNVCEGCPCLTIDEEMIEGAFVNF